MEGAPSSAEAWTKGWAPHQPQARGFAPGLVNSEQGSSYFWSECWGRAGGPARGEERGQQATHTRVDRGTWPRGKAAFLRLSSMQLSL